MVTGVVTALGIAGVGSKTVSEAAAGEAVGDDSGAGLATALRLACVALALNAAVNAVELVANPTAFSKEFVLSAAAMDLALALALWTRPRWREPVRRFVIVRVLFGLLVFGATVFFKGDRIGAAMQATLSGSLLLLLVGEASRARARAGVALNALVQLARVVIVLGALRGYSLLGPITEGAKYEPATAEVRGRTYDYRLRLPAGWRVMKPAETDAMGLGADRVAARLVRDVQLSVIPSRIRWNQRFDAQPALDSVVNNARDGMDGFALVQRGTLGAPLRSPFVEYRGTPRADGAPAVTALVTVVRGAEGAVYTLLAIRRANAPAPVRDEALAAMQGFEPRREPLVARSPALAESLEAAPADGLCGRRTGYRLRVEPGWFVRKESAREEGQDQALIVPFEDVMLSTSVLRAGNSIDAAGTARQAVSRMGATSTPQFEPLAMRENMPGAMLRYRANVGGDQRVGVVAVFVRDSGSVLALASVPASLEAARMPEVERMLGSFAFE